MMMANYVWQEVQLVRTFRIAPARIPLLRMQTLPRAYSQKAVVELFYSSSTSRR